MISVTTINRWLRWTGFALFFTHEETLKVGFQWVGFETDAPVPFEDARVLKATEVAEKILSQYDPTTSQSKNVEGFAYCRGMTNAAALILRHLKGK